jgi:parallel beta-helix repeat protein
MKINTYSSIIYKLLFIVCIQGLLGLQQVYAATYYVSPYGNNTYPGTLSAPWQTITKAANTLVAGDTVIIRAGIYNEQVTPKNSGNPFAGYITYKAYPDETVTVNANNRLNWTWNGVFGLAGRSYITISGLRIINSPGFGIMLSGSSNVNILNNYIYNTGYSGIWVGDRSDSIIVDRNEVVHTNTQPNQEALTVHNSTNVKVSNNRVHDGLKEGIDVKGSTNVMVFGNNVYDIMGMGIYVDSYQNIPLNIEIYNNTIHDTKLWTNYGASQDGIMLAAEQGNTIDSVKIYNNVIYNIAQTGILLSKFHFSGPEPQFKNISIYNNSIYKTNMESNHGGGINVQGWANANISVRNNILSSTGFNILTSSGTTISHNLFNGGAVSGSNAIIGSPLFINAAGNDFHLQANSPAINVGLSVGAPSSDFDLKGRPQGGQVDIGAFEYGSSNTSTVTSTVNPPATLNITSFFADNATATSARITWITNVPSSGTVAYAICPDCSKMYASFGALSTNHAINLTGLPLRSQTYWYWITAKDSGGVTVTSSMASFRTTP